MKATLLQQEGVLLRESTNLQLLMLAYICMIVDTMVCTSIMIIWATTSQRKDLHMQQTYIIRAGLHIKDEVGNGTERYWPIWHGLAIFNGFAMKGKQIIIPYIL